mgnify:CR=1 FL=1
MPLSIEELLLTSLRDANWRTDPWHYAHIPAVLPAQVAERVAAEFPAALLARCSRPNGEKSYSFGTAAIDADTRWAEDATALPELIEALAGNEYRKSLGELTDTDLTDAQLTIGLWEYAAGHWLAPHVDKEEKVVTQIFYVTEGWQENDGGRLLILGSSDQKDIRAAHAPALGSSAALGGWC